MHFSDVRDGSGSKFTKIAIVTALHLAVGAALVHNMNSKSFTLPKVVEDMVMLTLEAPKPPPPAPEPPQPQQKPVTQPKVVAPVVEVEVPQQPTEVAIQATTETQPAADPGPATPEPAPASANTGSMFNAVADAGSCATPAYPAKAARNGETGTVALALLIGVDGKVSESKVQRSSGSKELDRAAQSALSLCTFKPAMANGAAAAGWGKIAYVWTLN
ncbi:MAG: energy transducer TonB [Pseudomonadota bacterium]